MFTPDELLAAANLLQSVGHRRFGHFDHDAGNHIGPIPSAGTVHETEETQGGEATHGIGFAACEIDPTTGAVTYQVKANTNARKR